MTLFKHTGIKTAEAFALEKLLEAFETSRKRHLIDEDDSELVVSDDGANLSAVCHDGRLCWSHSLCKELGSLLEYEPLDGTINREVFLFTLVDVNCARSSDELNVDLKPIIRSLRKGIRDCNYIGVIEPGLYSHITFADTNLKRARCVSWHLHALVWGISRAEAKALARRLNRSGKYTPIAPGQSGVDQRMVRTGDFAIVLAYLLKPPKKAKRLGLRECPKTAGETQHIQYEDPLRAGERLALYLQMKHLHLPDMWIAGGEGRALLAVVNRNSRTAVRRLERKSLPRRKRSQRPYFRGRSKR